MIAHPRRIHNICALIQETAAVEVVCILLSVRACRAYFRQYSMCVAISQSGCLGHLGSQSLPFIAGAATIRWGCTVRFTSLMTGRCVPLRLNEVKYITTKLRRRQVEMFVHSSITITRSIHSDPVAARPHQLQMQGTAVCDTPVRAYVNVKWCCARVYVVSSSPKFKSFRSRYGAV